jgi:hypothetical protein
METGDSNAAPAPESPAPKIGWLSVIFLLASNVVTLWIALYDQWPLMMLLVPYWFQSATIGLFNYWRMRALVRFTTRGGLLEAGRKFPPTPATKHRMAKAFAQLYGGFHAVYLVFLLMFLQASRTPEFTRKFGDISAADWKFIAITAVVFAISSAVAFLHDRDADKHGSPDIDAMMMNPLARVVPIHGLIIAGFLLTDFRHAVVLFGALKTVVDVTMQIRQQRGTRRALMPTGTAGDAGS